MKNTPILLSLVAIPFLIGCGGGSATTSSALQTAKLTGTVPGTKIEAFCDNGVQKEIKSIHDGTDKHPFTLEIPKDTDCRIVMTTNEDDAQNVVITHLKFEDSKGNQSIIINISDDEVDIGHIPLPMSTENIDDANNDHVKDTPLIVNLASSSINAVVRDNDYLDDDNDDIINPYEDDDGDQIPNYKDTDYYGGDYKGSKGSDDKGSRGSKGSYDDKGSKGSYDDKGSKGSDDKGSHGSKGSYDNYSNNYNNNYNNNYTPIMLPKAYTPDPGRLLGSQCAQCHGTNGISVNKWDSIAGEDKLHEEMFEEGFGHIMTAQAKGYTPHEINLMETWLQTLKYKD